MSTDWPVNQFKDFSRAVILPLQRETFRSRMALVDNCAHRFPRYFTLNHNPIWSGLPPYKSSIYRLWPIGSLTVEFVHQAKGVFFTMR